MIRSVLSVVSAVLAWGFLWTAANSAGSAALPTRFDEAGFTSDANLLVGFIAVSALLSVGAGWLCATLARRSEMKHVTILALLQLAIGIGVQVSVWERMPIWYHVIFLGLVVPMHLVGGRLRAGRSIGVTEPQHI